MKISWFALVTLTFLIFFTSGCRPTVVSAEHEGALEGTLTISALVTLVIDLLAGILSVVYGIWGIITVVPFIEKKISPILKSRLGFVPIFHSENSTGYSVLVGDVDIYDRQIDVTEIRTQVGLLAPKPFPLPMSIFEIVACGRRIHRLEVFDKGNGPNLDKNVERYLLSAGLVG